MSGALLFAGIVGIGLLSGHDDNSEKIMGSGSGGQGITGQNSEAPWAREVESSMSSGRYILPPERNAVFYCNRLLAKDPRISKAQVFKDQSIRLALAQAEEKARLGRTSEAREIYLALQALLQSEGRLPVTSQELEQGLKKTEFSSYPVVHDHFIGSCHGKLKFNAYVISFVPLENSRDGFVERLAGISLGIDGKSLKIKFQNKTYKFHAMSAKSKKDQRSKISALYQEISRHVNDYKTPPTTRKM